MRGFRIFLVTIIVCILCYTSIVIKNNGLGLLEIYFGDIVKMGWPGQFNVDFMSFLMLSAFWLSWRHNFSAAGIVLGLLGLFGGGLFLSVYLLIASFKANGEIKELLLGKVRANS